MASVRYCTFQLAGGLFALEVARVREIIRQPPLTAVPLAPKPVTGLINLRGEIVPALDLRACLGLGPRESTSDATNVIVYDDEGAVSLVVDQIHDIVEVDDSTFEPIPDNLRGVLRTRVRGVHKLAAGLVTIIDVDAAIAAAAESETPSPA